MHVLKVISNSKVCNSIQIILKANRHELRTTKVIFNILPRHPLQKWLIWGNKISCPVRLINVRKISSTYCRPNDPLHCHNINDGVLMPTLCPSSQHSLIWCHYCCLLLSNFIWGREKKYFNWISVQITSAMLRGLKFMQITLREEMLFSRTLSLSTHTHTHTHTHTSQELSLCIWSNRNRIFYPLHTDALQEH